MHAPVTKVATKVASTVVATDERERSGLNFDNVGLTFSSLTMLLLGKSLTIIDLLEIEFMLIK